MKTSETFSRIQPLFKYLKKKRQNKKFIKSIELGATFFLISFFLLFAIKPTAFTISALIGEIKAKEVLSQNKMRPKINNIIQAQDNFASLQKDYHIIDASLPNHPHYSHIATQILVASHQNNTDFDKIIFSLDIKNKKTAPTNLKTYRISLQTATQFTSVVSLIDQLSNNRRLIDFNRISFSRSPEENPDSSVINVSFSADIPYWQ